jgi:hypothetical protein
MTAGMRKQLTPQRLAQIFRVPAILALAVFSGLFMALLGNGICHAASWLALSAPIVAAAWFSFPKHDR